MTQLYRFTIQNPQQQCVMSTGDDFWMPGQNMQCQRTGVYKLPMELANYLPRVLVCKNHLSTFLSNYDGFVTVFKRYNLPKNIDLEDLQNLYRKQAIWSELS